MKTKIKEKLQQFARKARKPFAKDARTLAVPLVVAGVAGLFLGKDGVQWFNASLVIVIGVVLWVIAVSLTDDTKES